MSTTQPFAPETIVSLAMIRGARTAYSFVLDQLRLGVDLEILTMTLELAIEGLDKKSAELEAK